MLTPAAITGLLSAYPNLTLKERKLTLSILKRQLKAYDDLAEPLREARRLVMQDSQAHGTREP